MAKVGRLVKDLMVEELTRELKDRTNFFVAALERLPAVEADTLRKRLRTVQAKLLMAKRTLSLRTLLAFKLNGASQLFTGSSAFVFPAGDVVQTAKLLVEFAKANQERLVVRGGWIDGQLLDRKAFEELASLPPKPQLLAGLVSAIEGPLAHLVWAIEGLLGELVFVLEETVKKKSQVTLDGQAER